MLFTRKLIALLLLGVFQVFVLHQAFPHIHHTHHAQVENHHHHHHSKDTHHHHQKDDANKQGQEQTHHEGLWGFILGTHSHSDDITPSVTVKTLAIQKLKMKDFGGVLLAVSGISAILFDIGGRSNNSYHPPDNSHNRYGPYLSHRGPPGG